MADEPAEPLLRNARPGVFVTSSVLVPAGQTRAIAERLGGAIERLTNSMVRVHGRTLQVNVITAVDDAGATAIAQRLASIKPAPFSLRRGRSVIEYVGKDIDVALATKASYELGFLEKPRRVTYRVQAELATIDRADFMACNPLFNAFLQAERGPNSPEAIARIQRLSKSFTFGKSLALRDPSLSDEPSARRFDPPAKATRAVGSATAYEFADVSTCHGVPFVRVNLEVRVDDSGQRPASRPPAPTLTAATPFWPVDDPEIRALARRITAGQNTAAAKANALLRWLAPGKNLAYSGQTGSRWGVKRVLDQKSGHCWDFSDVFVTLARASGIPARQVAGWLHGSSGHVWAEYLEEGKVWRQVDPTGAGILACEIYHVPYFTTDDGQMLIVYVSMPKIELVPTP